MITLASKPKRNALRSQRTVRTRLRRSVRALLLATLAIILLSIPGGTPTTLAYRTFQIVGAEAFVPPAWMIEALGNPPSPGPMAGDEVETVQYAFALRREAERLNQQLVGKYASSGILDPYALAARDRARDQARALEPSVNRILSRQVQQELEAEGLGIRFGQVFPAVSFRFTELPAVLVVSPRQRIDRALTVTLHGDLSLQDVERIEDEVARLGYSTLVVPIGGLGTYPSMIPPGSDLAHTLKVIAHEWVHHYLAVNPLGWRYALSIETDDQVITMNETASDIVGGEIGRRTYTRYYGTLPPEHLKAESAEAAQPGEEAQEFPRLMRETRQAVDQLLAAGKVEEAELYMEQQRQYLAQRGYYIRKLNQAYFAFYGSYAAQPGFANPVGEALQRLYRGSGSLAEFARRVADMSSYHDLVRALGE